MKYLFLTFFAALTMTSCSSNVDLAIDNPTDTSIIVKIDSLVVEIPPNEVAWVEMGKGEHLITLANNKTEKFNFQESAYMLNPTMSEYLMMEEYYGDDNGIQMAIQGSRPSKTVNFMGMELEGNYIVVKNLINPVTWDYGPREQFPEMVEVEEGESFTLLTKLYDLPEMIALFKQYDAELEAENSEAPGTEREQVTAGSERVEPRTENVEEVIINKKK